MERLHQPGEIIAQRYCIKDILGQGGVGITYEALDQNNNQRVALKALSLRWMNDWKQIELFEREARILSQLHHPAIPTVTGGSTVVGTYGYMAPEQFRGQAV